MYLFYWTANKPTFCRGGRLLSLFSRAVCYVNILEKIIQTKVDNVCAQKTYRNMRPMENCHPIIILLEFISNIIAFWSENTVCVIQIFRTFMEKAEESLWEWEYHTSQNLQTNFIPSSFTGHCLHSENPP